MELDFTVSHQAAMEIGLLTLVPHIRRTTMKLFKTSNSHSNSSSKRSQEPIEIDVKYDIDCNKLMARRTLETLFRLVRAENFKSLDSIFCDIYAFERLFAADETWWWTFDTNSGWTYNYLYDPILEDSYMIHLDREAKKIYITFVPKKVV